VPYYAAAERQVTWDHVANSRWRQQNYYLSQAQEILCHYSQDPFPGFYGSVERGPMPHHLFHSAEGDESICGPFTSKLELHAACEETEGYLGDKRQTQF
jgi:hypothetical protein